jgi:hypothetical protein
MQRQQGGGDAVPVLLQLLRGQPRQRRRLLLGVRCHGVRRCCTACGAGLLLLYQAWQLPQQRLAAVALQQLLPGGTRRLLLLLLRLPLLLSSGCLQLHWGGENRVRVRACGTQPTPARASATLLLVQRAGRVLPQPADCLAGDGHGGACQADRHGCAGARLLLLSGAAWRRYSRRRRAHACRRRSTRHKRGAVK